MPVITYYVALPFDRTPDGHLAPAEPRRAPAAWAAQLLALRFSQTNAGAVAFARTGNTDTGDYEDAVLLAAYGAVPHELAG